MAEKEKETLDATHLLQESDETTAALPQIAQLHSFHGKLAISPHSYLALSVFVAIFCGILGIYTLPCSIPAVMLSASVSFAVPC